MSRIVGIGANVCDTLLTIPEFPKEDTKMGATSVVLSGGGPCATGLVAAAKLGGNCAYIGALTDDNAGKFLKADLEKYNVSTEFVTVEKGYTSFSSTIWLSEKSQSQRLHSVEPTYITFVKRQNYRNGGKNGEGG